MKVISACFICIKKWKTSYEIRCMCVCTLLATFGYAQYKSKALKSFHSLLLNNRPKISKHPFARVCCFSTFGCSANELLLTLMLLLFLFLQLLRCRCHLCCRCFIVSFERHKNVIIHNEFICWNWSKFRAKFTWSSQSLLRFTNEPRVYCSA